MDFSIHRIESGPVRGPGTPKRRKERGAPEFSVEGEPEQPGGDPSEADAHPHEDDTPISPKLDDEAGGRLDVTA
jgi:hypothetical protein